MYWLFSKFVKLMLPITGEELRLTVWLDPISVKNITVYQLRWYDGEETITNTIRLGSDDIETIFAGVKVISASDPIFGEISTKFKQEEALMNYLVQEFTKKIKGEINNV